jgi:hypothetical protein
MGEAYKCDRCDRYSSDNPEARIEDYKGGIGSSKPIAARRAEYWLCPQCYDELVNFIKNE